MVYSLTLPKILLNNIRLKYKRSQLQTVLIKLYYSANSFPVATMSGHEGHGVCLD